MGELDYRWNGRTWVYTHLKMYDRKELDDAMAHRLDCGDQRMKKYTSPCAKTAAIGSDSWIEHGGDAKKSILVKFTAYRGKSTEDCPADPEKHSDQFTKERKEFHEWRKIYTGDKGDPRSVFDAFVKHQQ